MGERFWSGFDNWPCYSFRRLSWNSELGVLPQRNRWTPLAMEARNEALIGSFMKPGRLRWQHTNLHEAYISSYLPTFPANCVLDKNRVCLPPAQRVGNRYTNGKCCVYWTTNELYGHLLYNRYWTSIFVWLHFGCTCEMLAAAGEWMWSTNVLMGWRFEQEQ